MTAGTNVPAPTFGPNGFIAPSEAAILAGVIEDIQTAFGNVLNLDPTNSESLTTPQGQLATSLTALIGSVYNLFVYFTNQTNPSFAQGRMQDAIAEIYFIERNPSEPTVLQIDCVGLQGVVIQVGALIEDGSGNLYTCTEAGTIPVGGSITLAFANLQPGPISVPGENDVSIYQSIPGWDAVTVSSGVIGNNVESQSAFEARRAASVAQNSNGSLPSILGAVLNVAGVIDAYVTENDNNTTQTIGGYTLAANSLYVAVVGGEAQAVAEAIWSRKAPGCAYNGNTTVMVLDQSAGYTPPYPAYSVSFETPAALAILFTVNIANGPLVPSNAATMIQNAIISAFAGGDGGPRATIGTTLYASRFYAPIAALGSWVQIISIQIGSLNAPAATFVGSISGTTLTVSSTTSGTIAIGQTLIDAAGDILPGTTITAGSGSSWTVSNSQTVASETIYGVLADGNDETVDIDQVPTISAANIVVTAT